MPRASRSPIPILWKSNARPEERVKGDGGLPPVIGFFSKTSSRWAQHPAIGGVLSRKRRASAQICHTIRIRKGPARCQKLIASMIPAGDIALKP